MNRATISAVLAVFLSSCNVIQENYVGAIYPNVENARVTSEGRSYIDSDKCERIGTSYFVHNQALSNDQFEKVAEYYGAHYVTVSRIDRGTSQHMAAIPMPTTNTTYHTGNVYSGGYSGSYSGTSTTYGTTYVPMLVTNHWVEYRAKFYRKRNELYDADGTSLKQRYKKRSESL